MAIAPEKPARAAGRKAIRLSVTPSDLLSETPDLVNVWTAQVITLLPQAFPGILGESLIGRALQEGLWQLQTYNLRDFGDGRHLNVDDTPAGGGAGMVIRPDVMARAIGVARARISPRAPIIYLSPRGRRMDQALMRDLAAGDGVTLVCGRFEGLDQRAIDAFGMIEVSLGDFVMTGGEIAAQALIDSTVRLIPRVLGNQASIENESFSDGLLEHDQYTKPATWQGRDIPEVLLSGHHAKIEAWRREQAERLTKERRADLWRAWCAAHNRDPNEDQELSDA
ncbi:tRNA (guanine37-N1)-methyltransferase [Ketogulonicigenium robustum]|uniref:tRNA (guanine-N(1)-)-methyltransferase n=1 Tax=Ketogulonicigenium robustum TaxID=92947 RepID=A0A1W6NWR7_9RHOB|nr:tRNA (guanosine(37)-N1)-methyltransferase TrmD [Ketogulonicigenium robustum]ARO13457.1 tRNA (guanine37-N1)-methyltransferase [Ketogulonicigenium robustum]